MDAVELSKEASVSSIQFQPVEEFTVWGGIYYADVSITEQQYLLLASMLILVDLVMVCLS